MPKIWPKLKPERIADICFAAYEKLPKSGKPIQGKEWTILSCILQYQSIADDLQTVSLGTGTKCLGANDLNSTGSVLHDSHAEIMARRGFLKYIYSQMLQTKVNTNSSTSIFTYDTLLNKFHLNENVSFHFFSTHSPCGDASIYTAAKLNDNNESTAEEPLAKRLKPYNDYDMDNIGSMTGAKLFNSAKGADLMEQTIEVIRTKPGRGIRTLSVSCSDKLLRWNILGIQGALLDNLLVEPIYLQTITICGHCDTLAMERAVWKRCSGKLIEKHDKFILQQPIVQRIFNENYQFIYRQQNSLQPTSASIVWCKCDGENLKSIEISVNGKRQGITKKKCNTNAARLQICKIELFKLYLKVLKQFCNCSDEHLTYKCAKDNSTEYRNYWMKLREDIFVDWTQKPEGLTNFYCTKGDGS